MIIASGLATGGKHLEKGIVCQDNLNVWNTKDIFAFAVADGAGSASLSQDGSKLAVEAFRSNLVKQIFLNPHDVNLIATFENIRFILEKEAINRNCDIEELNTTIFGGLYYDGKLNCAGVGDSIGFILDSEDKIIIPIEPTTGDFINETIFITSENWRDYLKLSEAILKPKALLAGSDGLKDIFYSVVSENGLWKVIPHEDVIKGIIDYLFKKFGQIDINHEVSTLLASDKANRLNDDDKSLIMAIFSKEILV